MLNASKLIVPVFILLLVIFPQRAYSQDRATATSTTLEQMADQLAGKLSSGEHLRIIVLDFSAPDDRSLPFGAYLADEFSAALVKHADYSE